ncbi:unnamed protein product [Amoebophrya sp. A120]|nr:unnamed protein product [Amoebophrya sp. A120]|eukprot:GSA120T00016269001.1
MENRATLTEELVLNRAKCASLDQVKNLNLWGNDLADVSLVEKLPALEVCSLSVNKIHSLRPFAKCVHLRELYLRKNDVKSLEEIQFLEKLPELRVLWLADNPIAEIPDYKDYVLSRLPNLQRLDSDVYTSATTSGANSASSDGDLTGDANYSVGGLYSARGGGNSHAGAGTASPSAHGGNPVNLITGTSKAGPSSGGGASTFRGQNNAPGSARPKLRARRSSITAGSDGPGSVKKRTAQEIHEAIWKDQNPHMSYSTLDSRHMKDMSTAATKGGGKIPDIELVLHPNHERRWQQQQQQLLGGTTSQQLSQDITTQTPLKEKAKKSSLDGNANDHESARASATVETAGRRLGGVERAAPEDVQRGEQFHAGNNSTQRPKRPGSPEVLPPRSTKGASARDVSKPTERSDNILCAIMALLQEVDSDGLKMVINSCEKLLEQ